jgi:DNA helicase-2/ATP-dependent DNA helicase PcrA
LLGCLPGVGAGTCDNVATAVLNAVLRYRDIFYIPLPNHFLKSRALRAVNQARTICAQLTGWNSADTLAHRSGDLVATLAGTFGAAEADKWATIAALLPPDIAIEELRDFLWADNDEQQARILERVYLRLNLQPPPTGFLPQRVRLMTMHGAKGLSATVVFVPGLEETLLPGNFRQPFPGLVLEAARLLYVSITRARAACVLSFADRRLIYGKMARQHSSHFLAHTAGGFHPQYTGLTNAEIGRIAVARANVI